MSDTVALFITWTTYGTWLPGDERGYVSNTLSPRGGFRRKRNQPGTPFAADDAHTRERARALQKWPTVWLTAAQASTVANSLVDAATKRKWMILRAAVMSNHVHVVATGDESGGVEPRRSGETIRRILKGNSQAALSDAVGESRRWWTAGGSDRRRSGVRSIEATIQYVADQPGKLAEVIENVVMVPDGGDDRRG